MTTAGVPDPVPAADAPAAATHHGSRPADAAPGQDRHTGPDQGGAVHQQPARLDAVLVGRLAPLAFGRGPSGIAKSAVTGPVRISVTGLAGDEQGDPRHHGGPDKAVHHYARDHYPVWHDWAPEAAALRRPGAFGENLSTHGLTEADVHIGDVYRVGGALLQVSQGRQPCWKLDARLGRRGTARRMQALRLTGWYYRVLEPGDVAAGDLITLQERPEPDWPLSRALRALFDRSVGPEEWRAAADVPTMSANWRETFTRRLRERRIEDWSARLGDRPRREIP